MRPLRTAGALWTRVTPELADASEGRLAELEEFGSNPGKLRAWVYIPPELPPASPLVVVLHGGGQTALQYDQGAGWSELAERHGFALLFPEQQRSNNHKLCFNWFMPRGYFHNGGESLSIRQMIETCAAKYKIDRRRIFITGLSAGGAMTSAMLALYPDIFAGGAIVAGLPYGCASNVSEALDAMRGAGMDAEELQSALRDASDFGGAWPYLSVWHGNADQMVHPANAEAIVTQWRAIHALDDIPNRTELVDGYPRRVWCDHGGREVLEMYSIAGMGHGLPIDADSASSDAYMLNVKISCTKRVAEFWGLTAPHSEPAVHQIQAARPPSPSERAGGRSLLRKALHALGLRPD